jgi:hypothetical protein
MAFRKLNACKGTHSLPRSADVQEKLPSSIGEQFASKTKRVWRVRAGGAQLKVAE